MMAVFPAGGPVTKFAQATRSARATFRQPMCD